MLKNILKIKSKLYTKLNQLINPLIKFELAKVIKANNYLTKFDNIHFYEIEKPYWYKWQSTWFNLHQTDRIINGKIIGNGAVLNKKGIVILESTVFQIEYLNLLKINHKILLHGLLNYLKIGQVISLSHPGLSNYYHWVIETLPRLIQVEEKDIKSSSILINKNAPSFVKESLKSVYGVADEQFKYTDQSTKYISTNVLVPPFTHERNAQTNWTNISNPDSLKLTRKLVLNRVGINNYNSPTHVLISRKKARERRITNEDELMLHLAPIGFKQIFCEDLTFEQQVNLFRNVKVVISTHGAALSNLLFAPEQTTLIELFPKNRNIRDGVCFAQISAILNHNHSFVGYEPMNEIQDLTIQKETIDLIKKIISNLAEKTKI
jgi:hypothetical protein